MSIANADLETDLFFVVDDPYEPRVVRRGLVEALETTNSPTGAVAEAVWICQVNPEVDGAPEEIADALNKKPKLEALLIQAAAVMRGGTIDPELATTDLEKWTSLHEAALNALADQIEEAIVGE